MDRHQLSIQTMQELVSNTHHYINLIAVSIVLSSFATLFVMLA